MAVDLHVEPSPSDGFYRRVVGPDRVVCRLCDAPAYAHTAACPVVTLHAQLRELTASLGLFVATMRETLDGLERLLRGDGGDGTREG